MRAFNPK
jgi:hypothetical protein